MTDLALLYSQIRSGDKIASETLVKLVYMAPFHAEIIRAIGDEDAKDVMQETCVALFDAIEQDKVDDPSKLLGYASSIAHFKKLRVLEKRACAVRKLIQIDDPDQDVVIPLAPTQEQEAIVRSRYERVLAALLKIPERDRELIQRYYILEELPEQIQEELEIPSYNAFKVALHRARIALRQMYRRINGTMTLVA